MPIGVPIQQLANQTFSITLNGNLYTLTLKTCNSVTTCTLVQNGETLIENAIAPAAGPIIPAQYLESGNFTFLTANQQIPDYQQFGLTQSLFYLTADELATFRAPVNKFIVTGSGDAPIPANPGIPTVTEGFFNPLAALPLRFAPQGYVEAS